MDRLYMLSAKKVKQHGFTSSKWMTKDKITQYKGLISLYTRDQKIMYTEVAALRKKQVKEIKNLDGNVWRDRKKLDNMVTGDKQKLRNTLANHRAFLLMFQKSSPQKAIDMVHQSNFAKRKTRDLLAYRMKLKANRLVDLKLMHATCEDLIKQETTESQLPHEKEAYQITGKVQDAILKKEAAIYIRNSFKQIIAIMRKDSIYFEGVLESLRNDGLRQGKCMLNATQLGQRGAEYMDDRRREFKFLEKLVKEETWRRKRDLGIVAENITRSWNHLIRSDSDVNLGVVKLDYSSSYTKLENDMHAIEVTLDMLGKSFCTSNVEHLYPVLRDQLEQKERLIEFMEKSQSAQDRLVNLTNHAKQVHWNLLSTTVETTASYNATKVELKDKIKEKVNKTKKYQTLIDSRYLTLANIRISLSHIQLLSRLLMAGAPVPAAHLKQHKLFLSPPVQPQIDELESTKMIPELLSKFAKLARDAKDSVTDGAYRTFEILMHDRSNVQELGVVASENELEREMLELTLGVGVPTRDDIRKQGEEIVMQALKEREYVPPVITKKKYKFKK